MPEVLAIILGLGTIVLAQARPPDGGRVTLFNWFVLLGAAAALVVMFVTWAGQARRNRRVPPSPPAPR